MLSDLLHVSVRFATDEPWRSAPTVLTVEQTAKGALGTCCIPLSRDAVKLTRAGDTIKGTFRTVSPSEHYKLNSRVKGVLIQVHSRTLLVREDCKSVS